MRQLTPRESLMFRIQLLVALPFMMVWNIGKTAVNEFRSMCWHIYKEPALVWEEWIDAFTRGQP